MQKSLHDRESDELAYFAGLAVSHDSLLLASISTDKAVKVFDIRTLDMMAMLKLPFKPSCIEWIFKVPGAPLLFSPPDLQFLKQSARSRALSVEASYNVYSSASLLPVIHVGVCLNC